MNVFSLSSGSDGNAYYFKVGSTEFLIDCGTSCQYLCKALLSLHTSIEKIQAIFITHEHTDHIGALPMLLKKYNIPVYITRPSFQKLADEKVGYINRLRPQPVSYSVSFADCTVSSFPIPHDSAQNVGYLVKTENDCFGVATDIGKITDELKENLLFCNHLIIESNHDCQMVRNGAYPEPLKARILSQGGHLSNDECAKTVSFLAKHHLKSVTLAHLSKENNTEECAKNTICSHLSKDLLPCRVQIAKHREIVPILED